MLLAPLSVVNVIVSRAARANPLANVLRCVAMCGGVVSARSRRVEHDEAVDGVEGEAEGAERVAAEDDGRALLRARRAGRSGRRAARAGRRGRWPRARAARMDFAAREVARRRARAGLRSEDAERLRAADSSTARPKPEPVSSSARRPSREHDEGAAAVPPSVSQGTTAPSGGASRPRAAACARVEGAEFARRDVDDDSRAARRIRSGRGRRQRLRASPGATMKRPLRGQSVLARAERRACARKLSARRPRSRRSGRRRDAAPARLDLDARLATPRAARGWSRPRPCRGRSRKAPRR